MRIELTVETHAKQHRAEEILSILRSVINMAETDVRASFSDTKEFMISGSGQKTSRGNILRRTSFILRVEPIGVQAEDMEYPEDQDKKGADQRKPVRHKKAA